MDTCEKKEKKAQQIEQGIIQCDKSCNTYKPAKPSKKQVLSQEQKHRIAAKLKEHPEKQRARAAVREAVKRGERLINEDCLSRNIRGKILIKPPVCQLCGVITPTARLHAHHHHNYDEAHQLDVFFVCPACHGLLTTHCDTKADETEKAKGMVKVMRIIRTRVAARKYSGRNLPVMGIIEKNNMEELINDKTTCDICDLRLLGDMLYPCQQ